MAREKKTVPPLHLQTEISIRLKWKRGYNGIGPHVACSAKTVAGRIRDVEVGSRGGVDCSEAEAR